VVDKCGGLLSSVSGTNSQLWQSEKNPSFDKLNTEHLAPAKWSNEAGLQESQLVREVSSGHS
jgi:hypothetical protein